MKVRTILSIFTLPLSCNQIGILLGGIFDSKLAKKTASSQENVVMEDEEYTSTSVP
jgi:hypothetical protein